MMYQNTEVTEILRMIESEHLDIRTVTMGISLRGIASRSLDETCQGLREKVMHHAAELVPTIEAVQRDMGVPITNKRLSVTPAALVAAASGADSFVPVAQAMDRVAAEVGVDYIGGFSALVEKGMTRGDRTLLHSIPEALASTERVCSSVNVATTRAGINMNAILVMGQQIKDLAARTADQGGIGCAKLVVFANAPRMNGFTPVVESS